MLTFRAAWLPCAAALVAACSTVEVLPGDGGAGGGSDAGPSTSSGNTTSSSGTGGGEDLVCPQLAWTGDPIVVPFGGGARAPRLVRTTAREWAVVFEGGTGESTVVASFALTDPFGSWPPAIGPVDAHLPAPRRFAATEGEPGMVAFSLSGLGGDAVLAQSPPGQNGSTLIEWPSIPAATMFASRSPLGSFLLGRQLATARGAELTLQHVADFTPNPAITDLGLAICAVNRVPTSVIRASSGGWFVAAGGQDSDPFFCTEVVGPATFLHVSRITEGAAVGETYSSASMAPMAEVLLGSRPDGAWLAFRDVGSTELKVAPVLDDATIDFAAVSHVVGDEYTAFARHALVGVKNTWAIAELIPNDAIPGGSLSVHVEVDFTIVTAQNDGAGAPMGTPDLAASDEGTSFLVAFEESSGAIVLRRADCVQ